MGDCISRQYAIDRVNTTFPDGTSLIPTKEWMLDMLNYAPSVEPERPKGHWIDRFGGEYRCSECGAKISEDDITDTPIKSFNFCPFCGADMREGDVE